MLLTEHLAELYGVSSGNAFFIKKKSWIVASFGAHREGRPREIPSAAPSMLHSGPHSLLAVYGFPRSFVLPQQLTQVCGSLMRGRALIRLESHQKGLQGFPPSTLEEGKIPGRAVSPDTFQ